MFIDENAASGMFSKPGKSAADKFSILKRKEELLKGNKLTVEAPEFKKKKIELKQPYKYNIKYFIPKKVSLNLWACHSRI